MQYFHMRPHTAPPSPFMPGSVRCSGWGGLATAPDPGSPPSQGVALVLGSQVTSFFMTMKNKKGPKTGREREALTPPGYCGFLAVLSRTGAPDPGD